jgi:Fe-S-cluster containining protein
MTNPKPKSIAGLPKTECDCERCKGACSNYPGEFRPGEAEKVAAFLNMSLEDLFAQYLGVNWWERDSGDIFMLAPANDSMDAGREWPGNPRRGNCLFLKDGKCSIHPVKPYSCAHGNPCDNKQIEEWSKDREHNTVRLWAKPQHQKQIEKLLGRKPESEEFYPSFGILGF